MGNLGASASHASYKYFEKDVTSNISFACHAIASGNTYPDVYNKEVDVEALKGTDDIALVVKDDNTLVMSTAASVKLGMAEGDQMLILGNDEYKLMAVWYGADVMVLLVPLS